MDKLLDGAENWEVRPCVDRHGHISSWDICVEPEPDAIGVAVIASVYSGEDVARAILAAIQATRPTLVTGRLEEGRAANSGSREPSPSAGSRPIGFDPGRIQKALNDRLNVYAQKRDKADPFAEDDSNRHERYGFAIECFEVFAHEAGLEFPAELASEGTGA